MKKSLTDKWEFDVYRMLKSEYGVTPEMLSPYILNMDFMEFYREGMAPGEAAAEIIDIQNQYDPTWSDRLSNS